MKLEDFISSLEKQLQDPIFPEIITSRLLKLGLSKRETRKQALQIILKGDIPFEIYCGNSYQDLTPRIVTIRRSGAITIDDHSKSEVKVMLAGEVLGQQPCRCLQFRKLFEKNDIKSTRASISSSRIKNNIETIQQAISNITWIRQKKVQWKLIKLYQFLIILRLMRNFQSYSTTVDYIQRTTKQKMWKSLRERIYNLIIGMRVIDETPPVEIDFKAAGTLEGNDTYFHPKYSYYDRNWRKITTVRIRKRKIEIQLGMDFIKRYLQKQWYCIDASGLCVTKPKTAKCLILAENPVKAQIQGKEFRECLVFAPRRDTTTPQSFFKRVYVDENNRVAAFVQPYPKGALNSQEWSWTPAKRVSWVK
jgi:hypothetical protein